MPTYPSPMYDDDEHLDDRIARAMLGDSAYARQKVRVGAPFSQSPTRKLRWQGYLLAGLALVVPATLSLPAGVREAALGGAPLAASPTALLLGMAALALHVGTGTVLAGAAAIAGRFGDALDDRTAEILVVVESAASVLGLGLGAVLVVATNVYVLVGHAGLDGLQQYAALGAVSPLDPSGLGVSVTQFAAAALLFAALTCALAVVLERLD